MRWPGAARTLRGVRAYRQAKWAHGALAKLVSFCVPAEVERLLNAIDEWMPHLQNKPIFVGGDFNIEHGAVLKRWAESSCMHDLHAFYAGQNRFDSTCRIWVQVLRGGHVPFHRRGSSGKGFWEC